MDSCYLGDSSFIEKKRDLKFWKEGQLKKIGPRGPGPPWPPPEFTPGSCSASDRLMHWTYCCCIGLRPHALPFKVWHRVLKKTWLFVVDLVIKFVWGVDCMGLGETSAEVQWRRNWCWVTTMKNKAWIFKWNWKKKGPLKKEKKGGWKRQVCQKEYLDK